MRGLAILSLFTVPERYRPMMSTPSTAGQKGVVFWEYIMAADCTHAAAAFYRRGFSCHTGGLVRRVPVGLAVLRSIYLVSSSRLAQDPPIRLLPPIIGNSPSSSQALYVMYVTASVSFR